MPENLLRQVQAITAMMMPKVMMMAYQVISLPKTLNATLSTENSPIPRPGKAILDMVSISFSFRLNDYWGIFCVLLMYLSRQRWIFFDWSRIWLMVSS